MDYKRIRKNLSYFAGWIGLNLCSLITKIIPYRFLYGFAKIISFLGYNIASKQRKIALESLGIAFGKEKDSKQIKRIAKDSFDYMAKSAIELMFMMDKKELLRKRVELQGRENLDNALSKGSGVILVSAHFGNFPLLLARLSQEGYKVSGIMRPMRDERVEKMFAERRRKYNVNTIYSQPRNTCVDNTIKALRNNEIVFIPIDQNFGTAGVFVEFFGRKAATATGPVIFAQRTKAVIIPCFIVRQGDDTHKIFLEQAVELIEMDSSAKTINVTIQRLTNIIESFIRRYPAEWGWIHRRWKTQPSK